MTTHEIIQRMGERLLSELVTCYHTNQPFYAGDKIAYYMRDIEEVLFIDNEDIINHARRLLSSNFTLVEIPTLRTFESESEENDFEYFDIELKLIEND